MMTPEQKKIAQLTFAIDHFKKYDAERKAYYKELEMEAGILRSERDELKDILEAQTPDSQLGIIKQLREKIKNQRETIQTLTAKLSLINAQQSLVDATDSDWKSLSDEEIKKKYQTLSFKRQVHNQQQAIKELKKINEELLYRVIHPEEAKKISEKITSLLSKLTKLTEEDNQEE